MNRKKQATKKKKKKKEQIVHFWAAIKEFYFIDAILEHSFKRIVYIIISNEF